jgi:hypothetical protein
VEVKGGRRFMCQLLQRRAGYGYGCLVGRHDTPVVMSCLCRVRRSAPRR